MNGISHFLEHMVFQGTKNRTSRDINEALEDVGGHLNAYTGREFTAFYAKVLKRDLELALDVVSDLVKNPLFPTAELEKEKGVVVQEIKQSIDTPDDIIFDYLQATAFQNQAIGRAILGTEESVKSFSSDTLRNYMQSNYAANNIVVCAAGNLEHEAFVKMVEKRMSDFREKTSFTPEEQKYHGGFFLEKRDTEQAQVTVAFKGINYEDYNNYYPAVLLSSILGGGMSSRLFQEIREKRGLVYTVYSFNNFHTQSGLFGIYAGTNASEVNELVPVIANEINKICAEKVSEQELLRAKTQIKASILMSLENSSSTAEILARQLLLYNKVIPVEEMVERIENVSFKDIQSVAQKIFSSKPSYAMLGSINNFISAEDLERRINAKA